MISPQNCLKPKTFYMCRIHTWGFLNTGDTDPVYLDEKLALQEFLIHCNLNV